MNRISWPTSGRWFRRGVGARRARVTRRCGDWLETLESRQVLSVLDLLSLAIPLDLNSAQPQVGLLGESPTYFALSVVEDGRLIVDVAPSVGAARLTLLSSDGEVLVQSDGRSPHNPNGRIDLHLLGEPEGMSYFLRVESLGDSVGSFVLTTDYATTTTPFAPMPVGVEPWCNTAADLNADGIVDLAVANFDSNDLSVFLGQGDGTFARPLLFAIGAGANFIVACDLNSDGQLDLATANMTSSTVSILLGNGDGTFQAVTDFAAGDTAAGLTAADFNRDGALDLAVAAYGADAVTILLNDGSGAFSEPLAYAVGANPYLITSGDFNGDGLPDLAAPNYYSNDVSILLGVGDGTFTTGPTLAGGTQPYAPITRDFNRDGKLDLAVANYISNDVSIYLGHGDGTFATQTLLPAGRSTTAIETTDFNGDGRLDLVTANLSDATLGLFLGRDDGTFEPMRSLAAGTSPSSVSVADFNRDGSIDLAFTDLTSDDVRVLLGRGNASFQTPSLQSTATNVSEVTAADFNGDGRLDLASANYSTSDVLIQLGNQDGTFQFGGRFTAGSDATAIVAGDVNSDGIVDVLTSNYGTEDISVLLGAGDGTFGAPTFFHAGNVPVTLRLTDLNGDHWLDVVTVNNGDGQVSVLLGDGSGQFSAPRNFAVDAGPKQIAIADFNQDGRPDLAVTNREAESVSLLFNVGEGQFSPQLPLCTESAPTGIAAGDFNDDGVQDLAVTNAGSNSVSVFLGIGSGHFASAMSFSAGDEPTTVLVGDFNHDRMLDLATIDRGQNNVTVFAGHVDGTFQSLATIALEGLAYQAVLGDFNGDGNSDIATANQRSDVSILLGHADGSFQTPRQVVVSGGPAAIATTDFNSDGHPDFVAVNPTTQTMTVSLGRGDGKFLALSDTVLEGQPVAVATDDFNNDGRPDVAVANFVSNSVSILLGIGDGTFKPTAEMSVGQHPLALVSGDFNHDGIVDLVSADSGSGTVSILLGRGDGQFSEARQVRVGDGPVSLTVCDLNRDGHLDLIAANSRSRDLTLLIGSGDGAFRTTTLSLGFAPGTVATGDFHQDGLLDIVVANPADDSVSVLSGRRNGTFQAPVKFAVGTLPESLAVGDFNRDGRADIATANNNSHNVTLLLGQGDGTFSDQTPFEVGNYPIALITGDFNQDGRLDLATANGLTEPITVGLGLGDGSFTAPGARTPTIQSKPVIADLNADGVLDVVSLREDGKLLFRAGTGNGSFEAPIVVNPDAADAGRDVTVVSVGGSAILVAIFTQSDTVAAYSAINGRFVRRVAVVVPEILPSHVLAGDLNGDGLDDVVITSAASAKVLVYLQRPNDDLSSRLPTYEIDVGSGVSDVRLVDVNGDGLPEIAATDQVTGGIRVLWNSAATPFESQLQFRAGSGLASVSRVAGSLQLESRDAPIALVTGLFNDDSIPDLAVLNAGVNRVEFLLGNAAGGFFNPTPETSLLTGLDPVAIVTADWNGDGRPDLAVLNQGSNDLSIFLNDGNGGFTEQLVTDSTGHTSRINAGNSPTGMSVGDINGDGCLDLLLGNVRGDVLTLLGRGDGTFSPYRRIDQRVGLAVTGLGSQSGPAFALFDQSLDRVTFQSNADSSMFQQGRDEGLLAPSAVMFADLNADGIDDLIVSSSGSNEVFVYLGSGDDHFDGGHHFAVGTAPEEITVSDLNADGLVDLVVANHGSNDLSLLFGQGQAGDWTLIAGPRLRAGSGPVATAVADVNDDGLVDILVANHDSDDVYLLAGLGRGFFNDKHPDIQQTGSGPVRLFVGHFDNDSRLDVVTVNAGSNDLTLLTSRNGSVLDHARTVSLDGIDPVAAIVQDFNHDGLCDLIVADPSGRFALWLGGSDKVQAIQTQGSLNVANLSELVLGRVTSTSVEVYFTSAGSSTATLATFAINFPTALSTDLGSLSTFAPLPTLVQMTFNSVSQPNTFTAIGDEPDRFVSFDRSASFVLLPITMVPTEFTNAGSAVAVAEFSSPSESALEVIATLVLDLHKTTETKSSEEIGDPEESSVVESHTPVSDRDLLVMGALETRIQQHLHEGPSSESATEILFSSPLDLFDATGAAPPERVRAQPVHREHPIPTVTTSGDLPQDVRQIGQLPLNCDLSFAEQASIHEGRIRSALAVCLGAVIPLARMSLAVEPLSDHRRQRRTILRGDESS